MKIKKIFNKNLKILSVYRLKRLFYNKITNKFNKKIFKIKNKNKLP